MSSRPCLAALVSLIAAFSACSQEADHHAAAKPAAVAQDSAARFYYDLGSATVDVSEYPERQRANYNLFLSVCGTCHTTARPLNAPYADTSTWLRYQRQMHVKMENRAILLSKDDEARILEFLIYDSQIRKVSRSAEFAAEQEKLKATFEAAFSRDR